MALALKCECHWQEFLRFLPNKLKQKLMPFQREGIKYAIDKSGRCLLADEMGLGKTLQAICVAYYYKAEWPMLIVVPSSMKYIWIEEIEKWLPEVMPHEINLLLSTSDLSDIPHALITIVTYGLVRSSHAHVLIEALFNQNFKVVIADESHYIRNTKTAQCRALTPLIQQAERRILITGTPALSRPVELYPQLDAIIPGHFGTWNAFTKRYCDGRMEWFGRGRKWRVDGASNLVELQSRLTNTLMIRRLKKDVLTQLPPKRRQRIPFELKESKFKKDLDKAWDDLNPVMENLRMNVVDFLKQGEDGDIRQGNNVFEMRTLIFELYRKTCKAKIGPVVEYVKFLLEDPTSKFLVFAHHHEMMDAIQKELVLSKVKYIRIDGSTAQSERPGLVHTFQTQKTTRVAVLSILAAGVGLTFTAASLVVFAELHWTPGTLVQCEDRAHRIGQTNPVNIHYLVAKGSVDEWVWAAIKKKTVVVSTILNGVRQGLDEVVAHHGENVDRLANADVYKVPDPEEQQDLPELFDSQQDDLPSTQTQITDFFGRRAQYKQGNQEVQCHYVSPSPNPVKVSSRQVVVIDDSDDDDFKDVPKKTSKKGHANKKGKATYKTNYDNQDVAVLDKHEQTEAKTSAQNKNQTRSLQLENKHSNTVILDENDSEFLKDNEQFDDVGASPEHDWLEFAEGVDCFDYNDYDNDSADIIMGERNETEEISFGLSVHDKVRPNFAGNTVVDYPKEVIETDDPKEVIETQKTSLSSIVESTWVRNSKSDDNVDDLKNVSETAASASSITDSEAGSSKLRPHSDLAGQHLQESNENNNDTFRKTEFHQLCGDVDEFDSKPDHSLLGHHAFDKSDMSLVSIPVNMVTDVAKSATTTDVSEPSQSMLSAILENERKTLKGIDVDSDDKVSTSESATNSDDVIVVKDSLSDNSDDKSPIRKTKSRKSFGLSCASAWSSVTLDETIDEKKESCVKLGELNKKRGHDDLPSMKTKGSSASLTDITGRDYITVKDQSQRVENSAGYKSEICCNDLKSLVNNDDSLSPDSRTKQEKTAFGELEADSTMVTKKADEEGNVCRNNHREEENSPRNRQMEQDELGTSLSKSLLEREDSKASSGDEDDLTREIPLEDKDIEVRVSETDMDTSGTEVLSDGDTGCSIVGHRPGVVSETDMDIDSDDSEVLSKDSRAGRTFDSHIGLNNTCVSLGTEVSESNASRTFDFNVGLNNASVSLCVDISEDELETTLVSDKKIDDCCKVKQGVIQNKTSYRSNPGQTRIIISGANGSHVAGSSKDELESKYFLQRKGENSHASGLNVVHDKQSREIPMTVGYSSSSDEAPAAPLLTAGGKWPCHVCTFMNHADLPYCEMCATQKKQTPLPCSSSMKHKKHKIKSSHVVRNAKFDPNLDDSEDDFKESMPTQKKMYPVASTSRVSASSPSSTDGSEIVEKCGSRKSSQTKLKKQKLNSYVKNSNAGLHSGALIESCSDSGPVSKSKASTLRVEACDRLVGRGWERNKTKGLPRDFIDPSTLSESEEVGSEALFTEIDSGDDYSGTQFLEESNEESYEQESEAVVSEPFSTEEDFGDDKTGTQFLEESDEESDDKPNMLKGVNECVIEDAESSHDDLSISATSSRSDKGKRLLSQWPDANNLFLSCKRDKKNPVKIPKRRLSTSAVGTKLVLDLDLLTVGASKMAEECKKSGVVEGGFRGRKHRTLKRKVSSSPIEVDRDLVEMPSDDNFMQIDDSDSNHGDDNASADVDDEDADADISDDAVGSLNTSKDYGAIINCDPASETKGVCETKSVTLNGAGRKVNEHVAGSNMETYLSNSLPLSTGHPGYVAIPKSSPQLQTDEDILLANEIKAAVEMFSPKSSFRSAKQVLGDWKCNKCEHRNDADDVDCDECFEPKPAATTSPLQRPSLSSMSSFHSAKNVAGDWTCHKCGQRNGSDDDDCDACFQPKPVGRLISPVQFSPLGAGAGLADSGQQFSKENDSMGWKCLKCGIRNCDTFARCTGCLTVPFIKNTKSSVDVTEPKDSTMIKENKAKSIPSSTTGACDDKNSHLGLGEDESGVVDPMLGDLDAIFCRKLDPTKATWTCRHCGGKNLEEDEMCDECFKMREETPTRGSNLSQPVGKPCEKCEQRRKDNENRVVNLDDITLHESFLFCCSKNTSRVFVYDKNVDALNINFIPMDVETGNLEEIPELLLHPQHLKLIKTFVREWNSLSVTKRRVILRQGKLFRSPLAFYAEVIKARKPVVSSTQRYKTKVDVAVEAMAKADEVEGTVRIIERSRLTQAETKIKFEATLKRLQDLAKAKQRAAMKTPKKRKTPQKSGSTGKRKGSAGKCTPGSRSSGKKRKSVSDVTPQKVESRTAGRDGAKRNLGDFDDSVVSDDKHGPLNRQLLVSDEAGKGKTLLQSSSSVITSCKKLATIATVASSSKRKKVGDAGEASCVAPKKRRTEDSDEVGSSLDVASIERLPIDVNGRVIFSEANQGVVQAVNKDGIPLCLHCHNPITNHSLSNTTVKSTDAAWELRLCSRQCKEQYWLKTNRQFGRAHVFELEHGVCQMCNFDAEQFYKQLKAMKDYVSRATFIKDSPYKNLSTEIKQRMVKDPKRGMFWHVDHINPVADGGGQCDIDNLRTLCYLCHQVVTKQQHRERALERRREKVGKCADLTKFFILKPE